MKTLIKNGLVLLQDGAGWQAEEKDVLLRDSRIESIASVISGDGCRVIDAKDHLVMPGLINAHTHPYMTIHRNFADDLAFFEWLDKVDQVEQGMTEEDVYWTTMLAIIEMLRNQIRKGKDRAKQRGRRRGAGERIPGGDLPGARGHRGLGGIAAEVR